MAEWLVHQNLYSGDHVESLPDPAFRANGKKYVSFSTNNYLSIATSARLINAARRGLDIYGVGNCESRLLGGNLAVYGELEHKLAARKKKDAAVLFATWDIAELGGFFSLPPNPKYPPRFCFFSARLNYHTPFFH